MTTPQTISVVGAGRMGTPIIGHLVRAGHEVRAHDIDPARVDAVRQQGADFESDVGALAAGCDVLVVSIGFERDITGLLEGEHRLLEALPKGAVVAVLSTVSPEFTVGLSAAAAAHGVLTVDAPVCRGSRAADEGRLLSLLGGADEAVARYRPIAEAYSADVVHVGDSGSGQVTKAVNNLILWACLIANHEGLALAHRYGLDIDRLRETLTMSSADNHALHEWGRQTMAWAEDDMAIVQSMAARVDLNLPQGATNRELCRALKPRRYDLDAFGLPAPADGARA